MPPPVPRGGGKKPGGLFGAKGGGPKKKPGEKKPGGLFGGGKAKPKPAEDELPPAQPYEGPGFVVRQRAVCRIGFAMNTKPAKRPLKIGDVIQPIETRVNQQGVLRVHFADGWVSEKSGDGTVLLEEVEDDDDSEDESGSDSSGSDPIDTEEDPAAPTPATADGGGDEDDDEEEREDAADEDTEDDSDETSGGEEGSSDEDNDTEVEEPQVPAPAEEEVQADDDDDDDDAEPDEAEEEEEEQEQEQEDAVDEDTDDDSDETSGGEEGSSDEEVEAEEGDNDDDDDDDDDSGDSGDNSDGGGKEEEEEEEEQEEQVTASKKAPPAVPAKRGAATAAIAKKKGGGGLFGKSKATKTPRAGKGGDGSSSSSLLAKDAAGGGFEGGTSLLESLADDELSFDTPAQATAGPKPLGQGRNVMFPQYIVKKRAVVRSGFDLKSKPAGEALKIGQVVQALEVKTVKAGAFSTVRVRVEAGWISEKAANGALILEKVAEKETLTLRGVQAEAATAAEAQEEEEPSSALVPVVDDPDQSVAAHERGKRVRSLREGSAKQAAEKTMGEETIPADYVGPGAAHWMVRASHVEWSASKSRQAHRSRALRVKKVARAEFAAVDHCPALEGVYTSVDRDLWVHDGFPTWSRLVTSSAADGVPDSGSVKEHPEASLPQFLFYEVATGNWFFSGTEGWADTDFFGEATKVELSLPHIAGMGPVPAEGEWLQEITPDGRPQFIEKHAISLEACPNPDFGSDYTVPSSLAELAQLRDFLAAKVEQFDGLSHRHPADTIIKESESPPSFDIAPGYHGLTYGPWFEMYCNQRWVELGPTIGALLSSAQSKGEQASEFEFTPPDGEAETFTVDKDFLHAVGSKSGFSSPFPLRRHDGALQVAHVYEQLVGADTVGLVEELSTEKPVVAAFSVDALTEFQVELQSWLEQRVSEPKEEAPEPGTEGVPLLTDRVGGGIPVISPETGEPAGDLGGDGAAVTDAAPDVVPAAVRPEEHPEPAALLDAVTELHAASEWEWDGVGKMGQRKFYEELREKIEYKDVTDAMIQRALDVVNTKPESARQKAAYEWHSARHLKLLRSEWYPMLHDCKARLHASESTWQFGGLGSLRELCTKFIGPGGSCAGVLSEFFTDVAKLEAQLQACHFEVCDGAAALERQLDRQSMLEELDSLLHDRDHEETERMEELLQEFGFNDTSKSRIEQCEDAEDNISSISDELQAKTLETQKALIAKLTEASSSVQKRITTLRTLDSKIGSLQEDVTKMAEGMCEKINTLLGKVHAAHRSMQERTKLVSEQIKEASSARQQERQRFAASVRAKTASNDQLFREIMERLEQVAENEASLRKEDAVDKVCERQHQKRIAAYSQQLGAIAGCRDEMEIIGKLLEESNTAAAATKTITTQFLTEHANSARRNIQADGERVEAQGREWDTQHFKTYCDAFEKVHHENVMLNTSRVNVDCELQPMKDKIQVARDMRDRQEEKILKTRLAQLRERKRQLNVDIEAATAHEQQLQKSALPVLERLQKLDKIRDKHLLAIINECGFEEPPATLCSTMQERVKEKATKTVAELDARLLVAQKEAEEIRRARLRSHMPSYESHEAAAVASASTPRLADSQVAAAPTSAPTRNGTAHQDDDGGTNSQSSQPAPEVEEQAAQDFKE